MKPFFCECGQRVFFENYVCISCGRPLGFDIAHLAMLTLTDAEGGLLQASDGKRYRRCANFTDHGFCNWVLPEGETQKLCSSCGLNEVIPALDHADNLKLWTRVEQAKRRLLYSLRSVGLSWTDASGERSLRFRILEDRQRNPAVFEDFVAIAHENGAITINIAEADDAARLAAREQMHERYRTVLGHLRHESGHYYFSRLVRESQLDACRKVFGDERADYKSALRRHYEAGPPPDWPDRFVSAYASAHPAEDFAETFAHLLHIDDALETAYAAGLAPAERNGATDWIGAWITLAITLNEIMRSLGSDDPYPFVLTSPVRDKLVFIDRLVRQ